MHTQLLDIRKSVQATKNSNKNGETILKFILQFHMLFNCQNQTDIDNNNNKYDNVGDNNLNL